MTRTQLVPAAAGVFALAAVCGGQVLDFETLPDGSTPVDDGVLPLGSRYVVEGIEVALGWSTNGDLSIDTAVQFEQVGSFQGENEVGFFNGALGVSDVADEGFTEQLGSFFLRRSESTARDDVFVIEYSEVVLAVSGEIWDLDHHFDGGFERWLIEAFDETGALVASVQSPFLVEPPDPSDNNFDGEPWLFAVRSQLGIRTIAMRYTGTTTTPVGPFAFNNFNATEAIPGPTILTHQPDHGVTDPDGVTTARIYWSEPVTAGVPDIAVELDDGSGLAVPFTVSGSGTPVTTVTFTGPPGGADTGQPTPLTVGAYTIRVKDTARATSNNAPIDGDENGIAGGEAVVRVIHTCGADLAEEAGLLDLSDINAFVDIFVRGCP
jgi:hypothetical protein